MNFCSLPRVPLTSTVNKAAPDANAFRQQYRPTGLRQGAPQARVA